MPSAIPWPCCPPLRSPGTQLGSRALPGESTRARDVKLFTGSPGKKARRRSGAVWGTLHLLLRLFWRGSRLSFKNSLEIQYVSLAVVPAKCPSVWRHGSFTHPLLSLSSCLWLSICILITWSSAFYVALEFTSWLRSQPPYSSIYIFYLTFIHTVHIWICIYISKVSSHRYRSWRTHAKISNLKYIICPLSAYLAVLRPSLLIFQPSYFSYLTCTQEKIAHALY